MTTNKKRAAGAKKALYYFIKENGLQTEGIRENIIDLMANMLHLCDEKKISGDTVLWLIRQHWEAEREPYQIAVQNDYP
jgi:hypothetical protein